MKNSTRLGRLALCLALSLGGGALLHAQDATDGSDGSGAAVTEAAPVAELPEVLLFKLRSGSIQWGSVEDHSDETLTFRRLDTAGMVVLPWAFLDAAQELELRTRFGYIELGSDEMLIPAELLILEDGQELIGLIIDRTDDTILFKSGGYPMTIPKDRVRSHVAGLQAPALEIYTKEELYASELGKVDPTLPQAQLEMGEFCEQILDFRRAQEHYLLARELDEEFLPKELEVILERVAAKVENQDQVDALAEIDRLNRRKRYDDALTGIAEFDANFPDSPLREDRLKLEQRVLKSRDKFLHVEVAKKWFAWMGKLAAKASREMNFEQTLEYLEETFREEIVQNTTVEMQRIQSDIGEDSINQLFIERKRGRWKPASYGLGTWLLGEEDALKGGPAPKAQGKPTTKRDAQREKMEEQIQRFLRNQAMVKRARKSEEDEQEVDNAWRLMSSSARRNWIVAFYAENGGDLEVRPKPELRNCSECGGTGVKLVVYSGGAKEGASAGLDQEVCHVCHGLGRVRRIRYR